jgi:phenylpropionate dioxygenase-like ring-hydroxylating dioxygenase large terminal subunit
VEVPATASPENKKPSQAPVTAAEGEQAQDLFDWYQQWYPVAATEYLKHDQPNKIQLLNMDLVLWRDAEGNWRCFEDLCPHR